MITSRRSFLTGFVAAFAAPAIVRFDSIMPVKAIPENSFDAVMKLLLDRIAAGENITQHNLQTLFYGAGEFVPVRTLDFHSISIPGEYTFTPWSVRIPLERPK